MKDAKRPKVKFCCRRQRAQQRQGAMLVLIVFLLLAFLMSVAFSIDIAQMHLARTELRTATDAAAKAAATELADSSNRGRAIARGQQIAAANFVHGQPLLLASGDFNFASSNRQPNGKFVFGSGNGPTNTVRVTGRRTSRSLSGAVPLLFGNVTGTSIFEPQLDATAVFVERDITLVIDRSGSMAGTNFSELAIALATFIDVLSTTPVEERIGLASYSDIGTEDVQLTRNLNEIVTALLLLRPNGFTSISGGMDAGGRIANRGRSTQFVERTMIVMTDGLHNRGIEPRVVANALASQDITIHTITFGRDADRARMREVAAIGNGRAFHADNGLQLREVYREIALTLDTVISD